MAINLVKYHSHYSHLLTIVMKEVRRKSYDTLEAILDCSLQKLKSKNKLYKDLILKLDPHDPAWISIQQITNKKPYGAAAASHSTNPPELLFFKTGIYEQDTDKTSISDTCFVRIFFAKTCAVVIAEGFSDHPQFCVIDLGTNVATASETEKDTREDASEAENSENFDFKKKKKTAKRTRVEVSEKKNSVDYKKRKYGTLEESLNRSFEILKSKNNLYTNHILKLDPCDPAWVSILQLVEGMPFGVAATSHSAIHPNLFLFEVIPDTGLINIFYVKTCAVLIAEGFPDLPKWCMIELGTNATTDRKTVNDAREEVSEAENSETFDFKKNKFICDYVMLKVLGEGGFGKVYKAKYKLDDYIYAVKRITVVKKREAIIRVLQEVRAMAQLDHPGIIRYYYSWMEIPPEVPMNAPDKALDTSSDEEIVPCKNTTDYVYLYIQMQLCLDKTLYDWLRANEKMESRDPQKMKDWMKQMISAVDYIHQQGLIHRDIKPKNVLFDKYERIKIGDLGLVTAIGEQEKKGNSSTADIHTIDVGTISYMSPEQLANKPYTSKVDVFSLGLICTELNVPFVTDMERYTVLKGLQEGNQPKHLSDRPELAEFVAWLTNTSADLRPTCEEILTSPFLSS